MYEILKTQIPQEGDLVIKKAQLHFAKYRKWYAWNKPAPMKGNALIRIPARFETLLYCVNKPNFLVNLQKKSDERYPNGGFKKPIPIHSKRSG